jgi:hypothetical protein
MIISQNQLSPAISQESKSATTTLKDKEINKGNTSNVGGNEINRVKSINCKG